MSAILLASGEILSDDNVCNNGYVASLASIITVSRALEISSDTAKTGCGLTSSKTSEDSKLKTDAWFKKYDVVFSLIACQPGDRDCKLKPSAEEMT